LPKLSATAKSCVIRTIRTELSGRSFQNAPAGRAERSQQLQNCDDRNNSEFHFLSCREVKQRYQGFAAAAKTERLP